MPRTNVGAVQDILGSNYGPDSSGNNPNLQQWIDLASTFTDGVVSRATQKNKSLSNAQAEAVERAIAAYFYCKMDPTYTSKSTQGASGNFVGGGQTLDGEQDRYKRLAIEMDYSGAVNELLNRKSASVDWVVSHQLTRQMRMTEVGLEYEYILKST